ncbi:hypothetical protein GUITHDRAFT_132127 [Guillardia theta CCMP2712]|uniref:Uncharacterized protein n=1 Tax=Guillardia theta (strain CCMP2712) TaxID=905079 RepID=L1K1Z5_GUITC|nr:hypothetical protein GUITHDRAFT_132127 [Guillardia theta CCMP2712]EKX54383.1 hypothetical protein GUITHDRAFT_132127 [Guillardia theta CCMP2712]|eukprot:XP_005841363.1 hypothetical protein GUITHDRAFT_132127 [Guillardia theta CCMP2712]
MTATSGKCTPPPSADIDIDVGRAQDADVARTEGTEADQQADPPSVVRRSSCCPLASWLRNSRRRPAPARKKKPFTLTVETLFDSTTPQRNSVAQCGTPFPTPFHIDTEPLFPRREDHEGSDRSSPAEVRGSSHASAAGLQQDVHSDSQGTQRPREAAKEASQNGAMPGDAPQRPKSEWMVQLVEQGDTWYDSMSMTDRMAQRIVGISVKAFKGMRVTLSSEGSKAFDERLLNISGGGVGTIVKVLNNGTISKVCWDVNPAVEHCYRTGRFGQYELCQHDLGGGERNGQNFTEFMTFHAADEHAFLRAVGPPSQPHPFLPPTGSPGESHESGVSGSGLPDLALPEPAQQAEANHQDGVLLNFSTVREWTSFGRQTGEVHMGNGKEGTDDRIPEDRWDGADEKQRSRLSFRDSFVTRELRMNGILPPSSLEEPNQVLGHTARLKRIYARNEMGYFNSITTSRNG